MFSIPSLYELGTTTTCSDSYDHILQGLFHTPPSSDAVGNQNLISPPRSTAEAKAAAASHSHKEAERKRRKRISGHFNTLKSILPNTTKTDKASLLGEAVRRVRELKKAAEETAAVGDDQSSKNPLNLLLPSEADELKLSRCGDEGEGEGSSTMIEATLCCEDRPEMVLDMIQALKSVRARVVRAEMSTVGGRTKSVLWVEMSGGDFAADGESDVCLGTLRRALKTVVDKSSVMVGNSQGLPGNKRPRYYHLC